jgi:hypothetical protein
VAGESPATRLISCAGYDEHDGESNPPPPFWKSVAGAAWVISGAQLRDTGAFLTAEMNGEPLSCKHGAPIRLVIPSWYGCASIKWVNRIAIVATNASDAMYTHIPPTSQMIEFSDRLLQPQPLPLVASEWYPARVACSAAVFLFDHSVAVFSGDHTYRARGLLWGGPPLPWHADIPCGIRVRLVPRDLEEPENDFDEDVSLSAEESLAAEELPWYLVTMCAPVKHVRGWREWAFDFTPPSPGRYRVQIRNAREADVDPALDWRMPMGYFDFDVIFSHGGAAYAAGEMPPGMGVPELWVL